MKTILVVDDELELLKGIELSLESAGFRVLTATDGQEALNVLQVEKTDLILADIAMPRMNGYQLYERIRKNPDWLTIPFIFLTARTMDSDIRYGKELGVDDYMTKPIEVEDLLATVQGRLKRSRQLASLASESELVDTDKETNVLEVGNLIIDSNYHQAWIGEKKIKLSAREFTLLEYMCQQAGRVISAQELVMATHHLDADPVEAGSLIRPLVRSLRRKMGFKAGSYGCIENIRGVGYRIAIENE
ncbi:MAG: response regulator transcription factor [Anaerolineales bacterium]|nr:response regulator transcription factor [Anaerolineales bacterium]